MAYNPKHRQKVPVKCLICDSEFMSVKISKTCQSCKPAYKRRLQQAKKGVHSKVYSAISSGLLPEIRRSKKNRIFVACKDCGRRASIYDHRDYRKPLEVEPVCCACNIKRGPSLDTAHLVLIRKPPIKSSSRSDTTGV